MTPGRYPDPIPGGPDARAGRRACLLAGLVAGLGATIIARPALAATSSQAGGVQAWSAQKLRIAAAASLRGPLDDILGQWRREGRVDSVVSYAGTPALVRQIGQGLPADILIAADSDWMDQLETKGGIRRDTRIDLLGNRLVLIASIAAARLLKAAESDVVPELGSPDPVARQWLQRLANWPGNSRLAIGEIQSVPAGRYARAALTQLGLWPAWSSRLAMTDNVRAALALVARGETELGVVYASDAALEPKVRVLARMGAGCHAPIRYPAAVLSAATHPDAARALEALAAPEARAQFMAAGFVAPEDLPTGPCLAHR